MILGVGFGRLFSGGARCRRGQERSWSLRRRGRRVRRVGCGRRRRLGGAGGILALGLFVGGLGGRVVGLV